MRIAVVGAGFAGLATAKVLKELGHEVTIYEKAPDVGGVWSVTRRYTGLRTQNNRESYSYSDMPMPGEYPEWPTGAQVQSYLDRYVRRFGLKHTLRLQTEVVRAEPTPGEDGWLVTARPAGAPLRAPERFDHLVVANGIFSDPVLPRYEGYPDLVRAGGRLIASSQLNDVESVRGKHVVVVGYGKSACDVAAEIGRVAESTTVVARNLLWKMPKLIGGAVNMKYVLLTRLGENLFRYQRQTSGMERFMHGVGNPLRQWVLDTLGSIVTTQLGLKKLGLVPRGDFAELAGSSASIVTDEFYEMVDEGAIAVHRDAEITRFVVSHDGQKQALLSDGAVVRADVVVCGTGFHQRVPFLDDSLTRRLQDEEGNFHLWHQILPHDVPNLTFAGYNSSFFSPLSAEVGAMWIGAYLAGVVTMPTVDERRALVAERVRWMKERTKGRHARGTNVIPFSMHNIDETLADIGIDVPPGQKVRQWLLPVDPSAYAGLLPRLKEKVGAAAMSESRVMM